MAQATDPIHVKVSVTGSGNGSSWSNATTLQDALQNLANPGDEIWVEAGLYKPGGAVGDTFELPAGVAIYGGFAGTETERLQRDWEANPTVLSGDITGNDITDANGIVTDPANIVAPNSYHVVTADGTSTPATDSTILDGFTITAGLANGSNPDNRGGGFYCDGRSGGECSPTLTNVIFSANKADYGGAMFNTGYQGVSNPSLSNVEFSANLAAFSGGAMLNLSREGISSPILNNVSFSDNSAYSGGAIFNQGYLGNSSPSLTIVTFTSNEAKDSGGAMYNNGIEGISNPSLTDVTFTANKARNGGAMYNNGENGVGSPNLTSITFTANEAMQRGGAMYNNGAQGISSPSLYDVSFTFNTALFGGAMYNYGVDGISSPSLSNVTFAANEAKDGGDTATYSGGAMYNNGKNGDSSPSLVNVTFTANKASVRGGAMYNYGHSGVSSPNLTNVTFSANTAKQHGGAMVNYGSNGFTSSPSLTNVILWGNDAPYLGAQIYNEYANPTIASSLVEGGITGWGVYNDSGASVTDGGDNLAGGPIDNPRFIEPVSASDAPTTTGNLRLQFGSPAIDVGRNYAATTATDLDGNPRKLDGNADGIVTVDLGAYEAPALYPLSLIQTGNGIGQVERSPSGSACTAPCVGLYPYGTDVILTANTGLYCSFSGWSGDASGTTNPLIVTMDSSKTISATFFENGSVQGNVISGNGNGIVGVTVTLSNEGSIANAALVRTDTTDAAGAYSFENMLPGSYALSYAKPGYEKPNVVTVQVQAGQVTSVDDVVMKETEPENESVYLPTVQKQ